MAPYPTTDSASGNASIPNDDDLPSSTLISHKNDAVKVDERHKYGATKSELSGRLREKEETLASVAEKKRKGPLQLLDLPMDVLKDIIKEVTHTNDLTSLALTHSALHNLVIPHIYSRFDIVWPDALNTVEPRNGVDALTYGLATLVMREDLFDNALGCHNESCHGSHHSYTCNHCGMVNYLNSAQMQPSKTNRRLRRGNFFSQFTRKFSLGNGPTEWVQEYLITKESGKMLGTLIALTIARMPNLETFIWDMPTGILRDVWIALASLGDYKHGRQSSLDTLWIRLHDNREVVPTAGTSQSNIVTQPVQAAVGAVSTSTAPSPNPTATETSALTRVEWSYHHIEHPNFSTISPLRRLCVLNIDEIAYLAELSMLIERSFDKLRELRIGIASHVRVSGWVSTQSGNVGNTLSNEDNTTRNLQAGGEFAVLVNRFYDCYADRNSPNTATGNTEPVLKPANTDSGKEATAVVSPESAPKSSPSSNNNPDVESAVSHPLTMSLPEGAVEPSQTIVHSADSSLSPLPMPSSHDLPTRTSYPIDFDNQQSQPVPQGLKMPQRSNAALKAVLPKISAQSKTKLLCLEILELERVLLDVRVLQKTIDWSMMTSLTLFQCDGHEGLWKALRRTYTPRSSFTYSRASSNSASNCTPQHPPAWNAGVYTALTYSLNLKRIHTDQVSPSLISFLKETLAPNSLEWMFLQEEGGPVRANVSKYVSPVTIEAIYRGPIRRHRASLKKILIDSAAGNTDTRTRNPKWRKWMFNRELLTFVTSGKMSSLKEIAIAIDYKDWHFFLQRLPQLSHLRSLYVPYIADYVYGGHLDPKELALQIVDVIALRPEIELCYMGISTKCFEILENRNHDESTLHDSAISSANAGTDGVGDTDEDSDEADDDEHDDDEQDDTNEATVSTPGLDSDGTDSDVAEGIIGDSDDDEVSESGRIRPKLKLREILFYDDKITVFKARVSMSPELVDVSKNSEANACISTAWAALVSLSLNLRFERGAGWWTNSA